MFNTEADFENLIISYKPTRSGCRNRAQNGSGDTENAPVFTRRANVKFETRPDIVRNNGERSIGLH